MIPSSVIQSLREALKDSNAQLLVHGDEGYDESIKRWSETSEMRAVRERSENDLHGFKKAG